MSTRKDVPRNGLARALLEADPGDVPGNVPKILDSVERWECTSCGAQKFTPPERCTRCGGTEYQKTIPGGASA